MSLNISISSQVGLNVSSITCVHILWSVNTTRANGSDRPESSEPIKPRAWYMWARSWKLCRSESKIFAQEQKYFKFIYLFHLCNVNVNWYFLMEPSRKSHAIELSLFLWRNARWHHWSLATHSSRLQPVMWKILSYGMAISEVWCNVEMSLFFFHK